MCYCGFVYMLCMHSYLLWAFSSCTHLFTGVHLILLWVLGEEELVLGLFLPPARICLLATSPLLSSCAHVYIENVMQGLYART